MQKSPKIGEFEQTGSLRLRLIDQTDVQRTWQPVTPSYHTKSAYMRFIR